MARRSTLGTIANFMSHQTKKQLEKEKTTNWAKLLSIRPDPGQPRRLLPAKLAERFTSGQLSPQEVITEWLNSPSEALTELQKLADSVAQHGLINPISVREVKSGQSAPAGVEYFIVTGERRWWAHVLLAAEKRQIHEGQTNRAADQIKITLTAEGVSVRAHQLIENLIREDLNAVDKAQGVWALRYELSNVDPASLDADNSPKLVPWVNVEKSLGISGRYRRFITSVLKLSEEVQELIQVHQLSEYAVRPITRLREQPELQLQAVEQLLAWLKEGSDSSSLNRSLNNLVDALLAPPVPDEEMPESQAQDLDLVSPNDGMQTESEERTASQEPSSTHEAISTRALIDSANQDDSSEKQIRPNYQDRLGRPKENVQDEPTQPVSAQPAPVAAATEPIQPATSTPIATPAQQTKPKAQTSTSSRVPDSQAAKLQSHAQHLLVLLDKVDPEDEEVRDKLKLLNGLVLAIQNKLSLLLK